MIQIKSFILLGFLLLLSQAGHIYVEDPQIKWQNAGSTYFNTAVLTFQLDSGLSASDYLQITWPFTWMDTSGPYVGSSVYSGGSLVADYLKMDCVSATAGLFYINFGVALNANQWYTMTLVGPTVTTANQIYANPITLVTTSDVSANYAIYDENLSAGQISISAAPITLANMQVSTSAAKLLLPTGTDTNKVCEANYKVYIDFQTTKDWLNGANVMYMATSGFYFTGSCQQESNVCPFVGADTTCVNVTDPVGNTGTCSISADDTTSATLKMVYTIPILKGKWYRISATVQNPSIYSTTGGKVYAYLSSRATNTWLYYEYKIDLSDVFGLSTYVLADKAVMLFWGLNPDTTTSVTTAGWNCPIGIYVFGTAYQVYNKIQVHFALTLSAFSTSSKAKYSFTLNVGQLVDGTKAKVSLSSINTNIPILTGKKISCSTDAVTTQTFTCSNIAGLSVSTYWVAFSVSYSQTGQNQTNLGQISFSQFSYDAVNLVWSAGTTITTGSNGQAFTGIINDEFGGAGYFQTASLTKTGYNQVLDLDAAGLPATYPLTMTKAVGWVLDQTTRSALGYYTATTFTLVFLLDPTSQQICCTAKLLNCQLAAQGTPLCVSTAITASGYTEFITIHIIANPAVFDFSSIAAKGALPMGGFLSTYGTGAAAALSVANQHQSWCGYTDGTTKCGVYNSSTFADQATQLAQGWYNIWLPYTQSTTQNGIVPNKQQILFLSCNFNVKNAATTAQVHCVTTKAAVISATDTTNYFPTITVPDMKYMSTFKASPLYPSVQELDFIVCFRHTQNTAPLTMATYAMSNTSTGSLASTSVLHSQVYAINLDPVTQFRVNFLLTLTTAVPTSNQQANFPQLLRVGGKIITTDMQAGSTGIAVFFDQNVVLTAATLNSDYTATCASATDSSATCQQFATTETVSGAQIVYLPVMSRIVVNSAVTAGKDFNHYVIVQGNTFGLMKALCLALVSSTAVNYNVVTAYYISGPFLWQKQNTMYWDATGLTYTAAATSQDLNVVTSNIVLATCTLAGDLIANITANGVYPGFTAGTTGVAIDISVSGATCAATANKVVLLNTVDTVIALDGLPRNSPTIGWGAHFILSAIGTKYWAGSTSITTSFSSALTDSPNSFCTELNYKIAAAGDYRVRYIVICPQDKTNATSPVTPVIVTTGNKLFFTKFALPFYMGQSTYNTAKTDYFTSILGYVQTSNSGLLAAYTFQAASVLVNGDAVGQTCTVNAQSPYGASGAAQKVSFTVSTKITFTLQYMALPATAKQHQMMIYQQLTGGTTGLSYPSTNCFADNNLLCSQDNTQTSNLPFTLTSALSTSTTPTVVQTLASAAITINYWLSADGTSTANTAGTGTYKAYIAVYNPVLLAAQNSLLFVHQCNTNAGWTVSGTYTPTLTVSKPIFQLKKQQRSSFTVSWTISKPFWQFTQFVLDLNFLKDAQATGTVAKNLRCNVFAAGSSTYNFDFLTINLVDLGSVKLISKLETNGVTNKFQNSATSFDFKCFGAQAPNVDALVAANNIKVDHQIIGGSSIVLNYDVGTNSTSLVNNSRTTLEAFTAVAPPTGVTFAVTLSKTWNDQGMCSAYTFLLKATGTQIFSPGFYIIVEFSVAIPPKLNRKGQLYCEAGFNNTLTQTYCYFDGDRRVKILSNQAVDNNTSGYQFSIYCVENPKALDTYGQFYFAIDNNGLIYQTEAADTIIGSAAPAPIQVLDYSVTSSYTKSQADFNFNFTLPAATVTDGQEMFVQFDADFLSGFYKNSGQTAQCNLWHINDDFQGYDTTTSYVKNCSFQKYTRLIIYLNVDTANAAAAKNFHLELKSVPTPLYASSGYTYPMIIIPTKTTTTVAQRTAVGTMNNTFYGFGRQNQSSFKWTSNLIQDVKVGIYSGKAMLMPEFNSFGTAQSKFSEDLTFTTTSNQFSFYPQTLSVVSGSSALSFIFAPKATTLPGFYHLDFKASNTNYATIVPLDVVVVSSQCAVSIPQFSGSPYTFSFPYGGQSLPYVVDFSSCQPETSVGLQIYSHNSSSDGTNLTGGFDSKNFTVDGNTYPTIATYTVQFGVQTSIMFTIKSMDTSVAANSNLGKLVFVWTGNNKASYAPIQASVVKSVLPETTPSALTSLQVTPQPLAASVPSSIKIAVTCDQAAVIYYALSTNNVTLANINWNQIKSNTLDKYMAVTFPTADDAMLIYGYKIAQEKNAQQQITVQYLKSNVNYFLQATCINTVSQAGNASTQYTTWLQTDNGGRPVITLMTFYNTLTTLQQQQSCQGFASTVGQFCNRTLCPAATDACGNSFGSTTSTSTPATTTPTTTTTTNSTANKTSRRRILQTCNVANCTNCSATNPNICTICNTSSLNKLLAVGGGSCISVCPNGTIQSGNACIQQKITYQFISQPDPIAGKDTTLDQINTAVVSDTFKSTFYLKSGLPTSYTFDTPQIIQQASTTATNQPIITASAVKQGNSSAFFSGSLSGSSGFVFAALGLNADTSNPTFAQLKQGVNGTGSKLQQLYYTYAPINVTFNTTWNNLAAATQYKAYWAATNDILGTNSSAVQAQAFTTDGTPTTSGTTYADKIATTFFALITILFMVFIMI